MYDLVIIGSGPAGLSAAVYAKRACLDVVVLEKEPMGGGQMIYTQEVDNYLGLPETNGFDLAQKFEQHAKALEVPFISDEVDNVEKNTDGTWKITGASGTVYETKTVLLATGAGHRKLGVPGEETLAGAGVSYCATCDGAFFRNKTVAVVGGGDVALEDALYLAAGCEKVYLIHRRQELRGTKVLQEQVANEPKITFLPDTVVKEICGEQMVDHLVIANTGTGEEKELPVSGIFIAVGMNPQTDAVASVLDGSWLCACRRRRGDGAAGAFCGRRCPHQEAASDCDRGGGWCQQCDKYCRVSQNFINCWLTAGLGAFCFQRDGFARSLF